MTCTIELLNTAERHEKKTNENTSHVHGQEGRISLWCQYQPKWCTDLMQFLPKSQ